MKIFKLSIFIGLLLIIPSVKAADAAEDIDQGYAALNEAYQARRSGNQELAREKLAVALDIFRDNAAESGPELVRPETEYIIEDTPKKVSLTESKTLFKIEFKVAPPSQSEDSKANDDIIRQQQMILQKLILLTRENAELKTSISRIEANTKETDNISDMVSDIRDDISDIDDLNDSIEDVKDIAEDTNDAIDKFDDRNDSMDAVEDIADDISDLRDEMDILKDILSIVEDIKDDTDDIKDLEDSIDEVKDAVEDQSSNAE